MVRDGVMKALGRAIKQMRMERKWSQQEFARRAGVHYQTVAAVENGRFRSTIRTKQLCAVLGTTPGKLMNQVAAAHVDGGGKLFPEVADLVSVLMDVRGLTEDELASAMRVDVEDVTDMLGGSPVPQMWGGAAVVLEVSPMVIDICISDGFEAAMEYLGLPLVVDHSERQRRPGG
jgi:DNA-binding XRE family transcriptional regulator